MFNLSYFLVFVANVFTFFIQFILNFFCLFRSLMSQAHGSEMTVNSFITSKRYQFECAKISINKQANEIEPNETKHETQPCHKIMRKTLKQPACESSKEKATVLFVVRGGAREIWPCSCLYLYYCCIMMYTS